MKKKPVSFGTIVATIGSILIAVGIAWIIAQNWHVMHSTVKVAILIAVTAGAFYGGAFAKIKHYDGIGASLYVLGSLLYTLSIFLIAQIFSTDVSLQGVAWLFLLSWVGVALAAYIFRSAGSLIVGLIEFLFWLAIQFGGFSDATHAGFSFGLLALIFLFAGLLFYALSVFHREEHLDFANLYQWFTAFYFLLFGYILSFQVIVPFLWTETPSSSAIGFVIFLGIVSLGLYGASWIRSVTIETKEKVGMLIVVVVLGSLIGLTALATSDNGRCYQTPCHRLGSGDECDLNPNCKWEENQCLANACWSSTSEEKCLANELPCEWTDSQFCIDASCFSYEDEESCEEVGCSWYQSSCIPPQRVFHEDTCRQHENNKDACYSDSQCEWHPGYIGFSGEVPTTTWIVWIIMNIAYLGLILAIIFYGTWQRIPSLINLGIVFFAIDIVTRYIGFIIDLRGYLSLSLIFITGGGILLLGGWLIEKWRRKLIKSTGGSRKH